MLLPIKVFCEEEYIQKLLFKLTTILGKFKLQTPNTITINVPTFH